MADSSTHGEGYDPAVFWLAPARNFRTSARLHLQHMLCQNTLGFILEPTIQDALPLASGKPLSVADLACGNGAWLLALNDELSAKGINAQIQGFDVNPVNFPVSAFLPESVSFKQLDILGKLPKELIGTFDVVHIRAFVSIILNGNTTPLLSAALSLLKPGGWLQWEEMTASFIIEPATPDTPQVACQTLSNILKQGGEARGLTFDFLDELDRHLQQHGFEAVQMKDYPKRKQDYKGWTEDFLMVWEEVAALLPSKADVPQAPVTKELWADLFEKAIKETEQGVALHQGKMITVVGRKAD